MIGCNDLTAGCILNKYSVCRRLFVHEAVTQAAQLNLEILANLGTAYANMRMQLLVTIQHSRLSCWPLIPDPLTSVLRTLQAALLLPASALQFSDIFETARPGSGGSCPSGFKPINAGRGCECLKLQDGMTRAAAFFETTR